MAFQPDFILEYAHYLHEYYNNKDLIIRSLRRKLRSTERKIKPKYIDPKRT
jgi:hypothetical protein